MTDRYSCPNCDEWIDPDDWDAHADVCRAEKRIYELSEHEVMNWRAQRERDDGPGWAEQELKLDEYADNAVERCRQTGFDHFDYHSGPTTYSYDPSFSDAVAPARQIVRSHRIFVPKYLSLDEARVYVRRCLRQIADDERDERP